MNTQSPPWPYFTERRAAKYLGVPRELVQAMHNRKDLGLRIFQTSGSSGGPVWLYCQEDVERLASMMTRR